MTNEKKLKDLMARMVSMSPQPPEYPEEIEMAQPANQKRRSPAVIFAVAAVAVLALAIPLALWPGEESPPLGGGTTTIPPATTTTETAPVEVTGVIYLVQDPGNSSTGDPALVPFIVKVSDDGSLSSLPSTEGPSTHLLTRLDQFGVEIPEGFATALPNGIEAIVGSAGAQLITLDMNQKFLEGAGGLLADITMLNQLVYTATQENPGAKVLFTVEGEAIEAYGTEGLVLLDAVGRDDFLDGFVNPIIITEPVTVVDGEIRVVGRANVFEATVSYRMTGTDVEGFVDATCGTGCWGDFDFTLNADDVVGGSAIEIFVSSAEDGSPTFVVSIPAVLEVALTQP